MKDEKIMMLPPGELRRSLMHRLLRSWIGNPNPTIFSRYAVFLSMILLAAISGAASPEFGSYSVRLQAIDRFAPTKIPKPVPDWMDWKLLNEIRSSDKEPLNFADKYTLLESGCGTGCMEFCLINRSTGVVQRGMIFITNFPADYKGPFGLNYRRSSRLLIVHRADHFQYPVFVDYYVWEGTKFKLLKTETLRP